MKPTLLILPGWGGTRQTWQQFIGIASKEINVVCLELPCFGHAPCPSVAWGVEEYANFVKLKIENLKIENCVLLGHSFGGQVATFLVANNPQICQKLILNGAAVFRKKISVKRMFLWLPGKLIKFTLKLPFIRKYDRVIKKILYQLIDSPDYAELDGIKREIFRRVTSQDVSQLLQKITVETLIVWGTRDTYIPLSFGKKIAENLPKARLEIIDGGKHGLHIQDPTNLWNVIKNFILT